MVEKYEHNEMAGEGAQDEEMEDWGDYDAEDLDVDMPNLKTQNSQVGKIFSTSESTISSRYKILNKDDILKDRNQKITELMDATGI